MSRVAKIRLSREFLAELLLPSGTIIHRVQEPQDAWNPNWIELIVEHWSLPELAENHELPLRQVVHQKIERRFE